jgi:hypothetical protein
MIFQDKGQEDGFNREDGLIKEMIKLCGELPLRWQSYWDAVLSSKGEGSAFSYRSWPVFLNILSPKIPWFLMSKQAGLNIRRD